MAQAILAILLASAIAAAFVGRLANNAVSHGRCLVPWILAQQMTASIIRTKSPGGAGSQFDSRRHQIIQRPRGSGIALGGIENVGSVTLRSPLINQSVHMIRYAKARPARLVI
jgi:hypothetical protein